MLIKFPMLPNFALTIALLAVPVLADPSSVDGLPASVSGAYALEEWHTDAGTLKPPQVQGRFLLMGGTVATVLINNAQADKKTTIVMFGKYVWDGTHFAYDYQDTSLFLETPSGVTAEHKAPWEGMRSFAIQKTAGTVRLRADSGQEFVFTNSGVTYTDGKTVRVYRRISVQ